MHLSPFFFSPFQRQRQEVFPIVMSITPTEVGSGTSHDVSLGTTVNSGDLLIMLAASDGGTADVPTTAAANWTTIEDFSNAQAGGAIFKKLADGTEGGTTINVATASTEAVAAQVYRIRNWSGNIADVAVVGTPGAGTDATAEPPALTPGFNTIHTLWICGSVTSAALSLNSGPTDYTPTFNGSSGTGFGQLATAWRQLAAASTTPGAFTYSAATTWSSTTIAVKGLV
jgi:hypothetical protein